MNNSKQHILDTAFKLFLKKTFKEVTMQEIVAATGLSKGGFYHYYESKDQLFAEVINHFFANHMDFDYSRFSTASLAEFCKDCLSDYDNKLNRISKTGSNVDVNFYLLIFEAIKILPGFKEKMAEQKANELKAWKKIINLAKKNGEISSAMSDEQIAKCFININIGITIRFIMNNKSAEAKKEVLYVWKGLYKQLQASSK